jgi:hypothetical protein
MLNRRISIIHILVFPMICRFILPMIWRLVLPRLVLSMICTLVLLLIHILFLLLFALVCGGSLGRALVGFFGGLFEMELLLPTEWRKGTFVE